MASRLVGRTTCPECSFGAAHVKESEKGCLYRYCPECGAQYHTKGERQRADLTAKTRPEGSPAPAPAAATPAPEAAPAPTRRAPSPTPKPTPAPTPAPTATPAPAPTPSPTPAPARGFGLPFFNT